MLASTPIPRQFYRATHSELTLIKNYKHYSFYTSLWSYLFYHSNSNNSQCEYSLWHNISILIDVSMCEHVYCHSFQTSKSCSSAHSIHEQQKTLSFFHIVYSEGGFIKLRLNTLKAFRQNDREQENILYKWVFVCVRLYI